jgi:hypothetical protein
MSSLKFVPPSVRFGRGRGRGRGGFSRTWSVTGYEPQEIWRDEDLWWDQHRSLPL